MLSPHGLCPALTAGGGGGRGAERGGCGRRLVAAPESPGRRRRGANETTQAAERVSLEIHDCRHVCLSLNCTDAPTQLGEKAKEIARLGKTTC